MIRRRTTIGLVLALSAMFSVGRALCLPALRAYGVEVGNV